MSSNPSLVTSEYSLIITFNGRINLALFGITTKIAKIDTAKQLDKMQ